VKILAKKPLSKGELGGAVICPSVVCWALNLSKRPKKSRRPLSLKSAYSFYYREITLFTQKP
jgi:hypothetical protein